MTLKPMIHADVLANRVRSLANEIVNHYSTEGVEEITAVPVLNGALVFAADLIRQIPMKMEVNPIQAKSYAGEQSTGSVSIGDHPTAVFGKHILLIEDIHDTGLTLESLVKVMVDRKAASVVSVVLLDKIKKSDRRTFTGWIGFKIPDRFVVGYGLDHNGLYRNLPYIAELIQE